MAATIVRIRQRAKPAGFAAAMRLGLGKLPFHPADRIIGNEDLSIAQRNIRRQLQASRSLSPGYANVVVCSESAII
jgi:hypothetical protein